MGANGPMDEESDLGGVSLLISEEEENDVVGLENERGGK